MKWQIHTYMDGIQQSLPEFLTYVQTQQRRIASHAEAHPYQFAADGRSPVARHLRKTSPYTVALTKLCVPDPHQKLGPDGIPPKLADRKSFNFESLRRWMKQRVDGEISPARKRSVPELDALMPKALLDLISRNVSGRHTSLPFAGGPRNPHDAVDREWADHICAHVLLYREMVGIGTNHESETYLGRKPANKDSLEYAYYQFIMDSLQGEVATPLTKSFLKRMTFETDREFAKRAPFAELATVQRPSTLDVSLDRVLNSVRSIPESASAMTFTY